MSDLFAKRLRRAAELIDAWPHAAQILRFYQAVLSHQRRVHESLCELPSRDPEGFDLFLLRPFLAPTLDLLEAEAPEELARQATRLKSRDYAEWLDFLTIARSGGDRAVQEGDPLDEPASWWVAKILLQPYLFSLANGRPQMPPSSDQPRRCPFCKAYPLVSLLREDRTAETVRRSLICSLCSHEWDYARVLCPNCGEERPEKLPRYAAQEIPWMRVEACDSWGRVSMTMEVAKRLDELFTTMLASDVEVAVQRFDSPRTVAPRH